MTDARAATPPEGDLRDPAVRSAVYRDLHRHPELAFAAHRTAGIVADHLARLGFEVHSGIGGTGVVGVLSRGPAPTVLLRADMDALPVTEETGLPYASDADVMHACGHDVHVTCLLGAAATLAADPRWTGTLLTVFQPAEEIGAGAQAMVDDLLYDRVPTPDVVLGQHVVPMPAGVLGLHAGTAFAASDALTVTLHGCGGHASRPEQAVDPVVMAAATVLRLQTIVSREIAATDQAVLTVGSLHAGTAANVIADSATLELSLRTFDAHVRTRILTAIERIVQGEAAAAGAPRAPEIASDYAFPAVVNDAAAVARTSDALRALQVPVVDPGVVTGSEDVGILATAADAPCAYWLLGGADPAAFDGAIEVDAVRRRMEALPGNHSPRFAPVIEPTLSQGVSALVAAATAWLGADGD